MFFMLPRKFLLAFLYKQLVYNVGYNMPIKWVETLRFVLNIKLVITKVHKG